MGKKKQQFRIRNWKQYNEALVNRGSLTIWFDEESIAAWHERSMTGKAGRPKLYSNSAIQCSLTLRAVFHLPLRATEGLVKSLITMLNLPLLAPDYSTLSRRQPDLNVDVAQQKAQQGPIDVVIDATGLKIYGEGEWKVRQHGYSKRRTWRKLHLAVNPASHVIEAAVVTTNDFKDNEVIEDLLTQIESINQVYADGAYDAENCYQSISQHGGVAIIPPRKDAKIKQRAHPDKKPHPRDQNLRVIRRSSRSQWKKDSGYHKRSLAETAMFRFKTIFSARLMSRTFDNQAVEALIKCRALNKMTKLGMPDTIAA